MEGPAIDRNWQADPECWLAPVSAALRLHVERLYRKELVAASPHQTPEDPPRSPGRLLVPDRSQPAWSLDFAQDALANGRKFRTAHLKDDCTSECPAIEEFWRGNARQHFNQEG